MIKDDLVDRVSLSHTPIEKANIYEVTNQIFSQNIEIAVKGEDEELRVDRNGVYLKPINVAKLLEIPKEMNPKIKMDEQMAYILTRIMD